MRAFSSGIFCRPQVLPKGDTRGRYTASHILTDDPVPVEKKLDAPIYFKRSVTVRKIEVKNIQCHRDMVVDGCVVVYRPGFEKMKVLKPGEKLNWSPFPNATEQAIKDFGLYTCEEEG